MAVDRGGLEYTINVKDDFSSEVAAFRTSIESARTAFARFKTELRGTGSAVLDIAAAREEVERTTRALASSQKSISTFVKSELADTRKLQQESARILANRRRQLSAVSRLAAEAKNNLRIEQQITAEVRSRAAATRNVQRVNLVGNLRRELAVLKEITREREKFARVTAAARKVSTPLGAERKITTEINLQKDALTKKVVCVERVIQRLQIELRVHRRITDEISRQKAILRSTPVIRARSAGSVASPVPSPSAARTIKNIGDESDKTTSAINRLSFSFRRLFGILAAFTLARLFVRFLTDSVREAVRFNANIETATLGLASLFLAVGNVRTATGQAADSAFGLVLAQREARRQVQLLRRDALQTAATFDQLVDTFQIAIAPGLSAGLNVDEIRKLTVQISQAATAIGLPQNQLAEEIRSLLSGTIQARTTRIATALGITNEDIANAKEAGVLVEFLTGRFETFSEAGRKAIETFAGLTARVSDVLKQLLGEGSTQLFEGLKVILNDIINALLVSQGVGEIKIINPDAVEVVRSVLKGLTRAVAEARRLGQAFSFAEFQGFADVFGTVFAAAAITISGIVQGILSLLNRLSTAASFILERFRAFEGVFQNLFPVDALQNLISIVTEIALGIVLIKVTTIAWAAATRGLLALYVTIRLFVFQIGLVLSTAKVLSLALAANLKRAAIAAAVLASPILIVLAAIAAVVIGAKKLNDEILGINLKFTSFIKLVRLDLEIAFAKAFATFKLRVRQFTSGLEIAFRSVILGIVFLFEKAAVGVLSVVSLVSDTAVDAIEAVERVTDKLKADQAKAIKAQIDGIKELQKEINKLDGEFEKQRAREEVGIINGDKEAKTLGDLFKDGASKLGDNVREALEGLGIDVGQLLGFEDASDQARTLRDIFKEFPGIIDAGRQALERQGTVIKQLQNDADAARAALAETRLTLGLEGGARDEARIIAQAQEKLRQEELGLVRERQQAEVQLTDVQRRQVFLQQERARLSNEDNLIVAQGVALQRQALDLQNAVAKAVQEEADLKLFFEGRLARLDQEGAKAAAEKLAQQKLQTEELKKSLDIALTSLDILGTDIDPGNREQILELISRQVTLGGEESVILDNINAILRDRAELERRISESTNLRLQAAAEMEIEKLMEANSLLAIRVEAERQLQIARTQGDFAREEGIQLQGDLDILRQKISLQEQLNGRNQEALTNTLEALQAERARLLVQQQLLIARGAGSDEQLAINKSILDITGRTTTQQDLLNLSLEQGRLKLEEMRLQALGVERALAFEQLKTESPITAAFATFRDELQNNVLDPFMQTLQLLRNAFQAFSSFAANAIVDVFDPSSRGSFREKAAQFLRAQARQLLQVVVSALLASLVGVLIPGVATLLVASDQQAIASLPTLIKNFAAFAEGGQVPKKATPSLAHYHKPVGRAKGGKPPGLDPRDTVPIWTQPGEWVMRLHAVQKYGTRVMQAINEGSIHPMALQGLLGSRVVSKAIRSPRVPGFQAGGLISDVLERNGAALESANNTSSGMTPAFIVGNDREASRLVAGGERAFTTFLQENQELLRELTSAEGQ